MQEQNVSLSSYNEPERDTGSVTLVNAKKDENGTITECTERTVMWAWKKPADENGTVTYTKLTGDVRLKDVTFGYDEDKIILHDISLFAKPGQKLAFVGSTGAGKTDHQPDQSFLRHSKR